MLNTSKDKLGKSRTIPIPEWFSNLQLEYLTYKLREEMYVMDGDIKKFGDIAKKKKEKILSVSLRQSLTSIFDCPKKREKYIYEKFSNKTGMPNMQYTPKNIAPASYWDKYYFFHSGVEIYYKGNLYPILVNSPETETVEIKVGNKLLLVPYSEIKRDFEDLF